MSSQCFVRDPSTHVTGMYVMKGRAADEHRLAQFSDPAPLLDGVAAGLKRLGQPTSVRPCVQMPGSQLHPDKEGDSRDDEKAAEERATGDVKGASSDADNSSPSGGASCSMSAMGRFEALCEVGRLAT